MTYDEIVNQTKEWFESHYAHDVYDENDYYITSEGGYRKFLRALKRMIADPVVDDCCITLGIDECSDDRYTVECTLAKLATNELHSC